MYVRDKNGWLASLNNNPTIPFDYYGGSTIFNLIIEGGQPTSVAKRNGWSISNWSNEFLNNSYF